MMAEGAGAGEGRRGDEAGEGEGPDGVFFQALPGRAPDTSQGGDREGQEAGVCQASAPRRLGCGRRAASSR